VPLNNGQAQFTIPNPSLGTHIITVVYPGDINFNPHTSSPLTEVVVNFASSTTINSAPNPSVQGQSITFTATVQSPSAGTLTGSVTFYIDGVAQPSAPLSNGTATFSTSALTPGQHSAYEVYSGDSNFGSSTSGTIIQVVRAATTTTITANSNRNTPGQPANIFYLLQSVVLTATVSSSSAGTPSGSVTFKDNGLMIGTALVDGNGHATLPPIQLKLGGHSITAVYSGDSTFGGSLATALTIQHSPKPH
jgi:hypothetical protein